LATASNTSATGFRIFPCTWNRSSIAGFQLGGSDGSAREGWSRRRHSRGRVFKALADWRRRKILDLLKTGPRTTGELCEHFAELDRCTVMQHLGVLEAAELVIVQRRGRQRWNYLNPIPLKKSTTAGSPDTPRPRSGSSRSLNTISSDQATDRAEAPEGRVRRRGGNRR
jgi:DNA-binding transcriptional ArsR family regulator